MSGSVRQWLEELRFEAEPYDVQPGMRLSWSPAMPSTRVETICTRVRGAVASQQQEPEKQPWSGEAGAAEEPVVRRRGMTMSQRREVQAVSTAAARPVTVGLLGPLPSVVREGPVDRVKVTAAGKAAPRHWRTGLHALLTDRALFFADTEALAAMKSGAGAGGGGEARRLHVDLRGAAVRRDTQRAHSSKRNVLAVAGRDGASALLQLDDAAASEAWFRDIAQVAARHAEAAPGALPAAARSTLSRFFKRRPAKETLMSQGIYKDEPIFGNTLERLWEASERRRPVPAFVRRCTALLGAPPHVLSVGLYRTSGNLSHIQRLRLRVDQEDARALDDAALAADSDVLAGALKLFFRELQAPLLPHAVYARLSGACARGDPAEARAALRPLSAPHRCTLAALCRHLLQVTRHQADNQMSAANLAIVWGPSFTWPGHAEAAAALHRCTDVNRVVHYLIEHCDALFPPQDPTLPYTIDN